MGSIQDEVKKLRRSGVGRLVDRRMREFRKTGRGGDDDYFRELCFCILTANSTAERCIDVHTKVGSGFLRLPERQLKEKLRQHSCRFHTKRAGYIAEARKHKRRIKDAIRSSQNSAEAREWLVRNIKGIGYKEASHFLRNTGHEGLAIIDFHIIDILSRNMLIRRPKSLTPSKYMAIEEKLKRLADEAGASPAELDLYLWYMETGKILK